MATSPIPENFLKLPQSELARRLWDERMKILVEHNAVMKEVNRQMQMHLVEMRRLKEVNQQLQDDNQELRDLCCFLDDDRQKGRKLAREWQRFGRYTASVMRQEVSAYQNKLWELERQQQELVKDNLEIKELCLYLDDERSKAVCTNCGSPINGRRDDGDGTSNSSTNEEGVVTSGNKRETSNLSTAQKVAMDEAVQKHRSVLNEQVLQYVRTLEKKVLQLEEEVNNLRKENPDTNSSVNKPEAVVQAMKVLEVQEQLRESHDSDIESIELDEGEKDLIREMCNVVWRKLEDGPAKSRKKMP